MKRGIIKQSKDIVLNHTLSEYMKKYGKRSYCLLKFTKKEVESFEKLHSNARKGELLKGKKWWLIGDTYYEVGHSLKGVKVNGKVAISVLAGCCVAAAIAVPTTLAIINRKPVTPEPGPGPVPPTPVVKGIEVSTKSLELTKGEVKTINAKIITSNEDEAIQWTVSNESDVGIINLSSNQSNSGVDITVTGNKVGSVKLTASISGFTDSCTITVSDPQVTSLSLNKSEVTLDFDKSEIGSVTAYGNPTEATIQWSSTSDKIFILEDQTTNNVCKFKAIQPIAEGENVTIQAKAGNQVKDCKVTATSTEEPSTKCLVSFASEDPNAGIPRSYQVTKNDHISKPSAYCEGKLLKGWYVNETEFAFDEKGMSVNPVTDNITLTAKWDDKKVTVTFDPQNGGASTSKEFVANSLIDAPQPEPTMDGWIFNEWKTEDGNAWDFATDKVEESPITLKGDWNKEAVILTVTFKDEDGTTLETKNFEQKENGTTPTASVTPTKDEYEFIGWYTEKTGGKEYNFNEQPEGNIELYARYKETIQDFSITHSSNHNLDCDTSSLAAFSTGTSTSSSSATNGIKGLKWSTTESKLLEINESSGIPTLTADGKMYGGKAIIKASKSYKSLDNPIEHEYEVEIGSFNKLDPEKLKEGIAAARDENVTGRIVIPSRYYDGSKWITINKIGDNGFKGLKNIDVYIPVPTIIIGANAFKDVGGDDFKIDFADKTNTWYFDGVEYNPTEGLDEIKEALKNGTNSEKVPTLAGLEFIADNSNDIKSYRVKASSSFNNKDLLIPQWYYEEGGTGHTVYDKDKSKPVVGLYYNSSSEKDVGPFEGKQMLESVTFQSNLQDVSGKAFKDCKNLQHVYFSPTFEDSSVNFNIEHNAFDGCEKLTELSLPKYLKAIAKEAFANSGIEKITLPSECGKVGFGVFKNCKNLNSITIEEGSLNCIPEEMFYGCKSLKNITIPRSVNVIDWLSFVESGLESIDFEDEYSLWTNDKVSDFEINSKDSNKGNAKKLKEFQNKYRTQEYSLSKGASPLVEGLFKFEPVEASGNIIGYKIISYLGDVKHGISTLEIPSSFRDKPVIAIDSNAFTAEKGVGNGLQIVKIPATIQTIGDGVFEGMKGLKKIEFDRNSQLKKIPNKFAYNCTKLEYVYLPDSVTFIGANAFVSCDKLAAVDVGTNDTKWKKADSNTGEILKLSISYTFYSKDYTRGVFKPSNASYLRSSTLSPSDVGYCKLP